MQILLLLLGAVPKLVETLSAWWDNNGKQLQAWWTGRRGQRQRDEAESHKHTLDVVGEVASAKERKQDADRGTTRLSREWLRRGATRPKD